MTLTFDNPAGLLWLLAAAAVAVVGIGAALWRRRAAERFAEAGLLPRIASGLSLSRGVWRATLLAGASACLAVALMDPRAAEQTEEVTRRGADVMFVVDVSRSMLAEDASPNRLERARTFISDAIDAMGGDRVGLIDFAGAAAVRAPLTLNYDALKTAVDGLEPKDSRRGGSMLGDAIRLAADSFPTDDAGHAIVILSDGEDMGSDPMEAAKDAAERGIRIITVGIGDPREGARIPLGDGPNRRFLVHEGEEVWSRMDAATLRDVAEATGGLFVPAGTAQVELGEILTRTFEDLQRTEGDASVARTTAPLFQWPAGLALLLLVAESMISARARRSLLTGGARATPQPTPDAASAPAPSRRRRRARAERAPVNAGAAVVAACAALALLGDARADQRERMKDSGGPVAAAASPPSSRASAESTGGTAPSDSPAAARTARTVGRGQIDRAAFRDAVTRANAAMQAGDYAAASAAFAQAVEADPTSAAAAYNRGVAEYRAGKLAEAATSFADAASRGDARLAADAMFNQGNATYQSALRALEGGAQDSASPATVPPATPAPEPDLKAATDAVSQALTHYKDAIAADPADVDSRANAELAHTLLKQLREMQKQQEQQQDQQNQDEQQQEQSQEDTQQKKDDQPQDGAQCDNPKDGEGSGSSDQNAQPSRGSGGDGADAAPKDPQDPNEPNQQKDPKDGANDPPKPDEDPKDQGAQEPGQDQYPQDGTDAQARDQKSEGETKPADGDANAKDSKSLPEGELKAQSGADQPKSQQQPPAPAQAKGGEPVPGAPLTKSEAERLLQGVRDRAKQRMEAKERAERTRQAPAPRDW